jgi:hypothetical protein
MHVEFTNKSDTSYNMGNWNHFKVIHKIPEQHAGKVRNQLQKTVILRVAHMLRKVLM